MAMTRVKVAELKDNLSKHLRAVERGAEIEVTDRDRPIAHIVPILAPASAVRIVAAARPFATLRGRRYKPARWRARSLEILLDDRHRR
jgi:prevent-host-death family protein